MDIWLIDTWTGNPVNLAPDEHDDLGWFDLRQAGELHLAHPRLLDLLTSVLGQPAPTAGPGAGRPS
jgi:8-oxo-dGTP pyrophosphatase MutT (NUDIX family)